MLGLNAEGLPETGPLEGAFAAGDNTNISEKNCRKVASLAVGYKITQVHLSKFGSWTELSPLFQTVLSKRCNSSICAYFVGPNGLFIEAVFNLTVRKSPG